MHLKYRKTVGSDPAGELTAPRPLQLAEKGLAASNNNPTPALGPWGLTAPLFGRC